MKIKGQTKCQRPGKIELQTHLDTPIVSVVASKNVQAAEDEEETVAEEA